MFRNLLIQVFVVGLSVSSISAFAAATSESYDAGANVINVANSIENEAVLLQAPDKSVETINAASQPQFQSAGSDDESTLSSGWLFAVALLWFVILSNRRSI